MQNSLIELNNCGVTRNDKWLVRGVSLKVNQGQIVTLIGPNGSGKSTTAKMALGILKPDEGSNTIKSNIKISYVPQKISIDWSLPLRVIDFMNIIEKFTTSEIEEALSLTGIKNLIFRDVRNLSGGEFQRLLMARAIAKNPDFLVLDENEGKDVLPTMEIECENKDCDHNEAVWWMLQTRSADEPTTQFFRCTKCQHTWRNYA